MFTSQKSAGWKPTGLGGGAFMPEKEASVNSELIISQSISNQPVTG
jgi:hypothetical protein